MTTDRVVDLGGHRPDRESRQEIPFNADGALIASRFPQGRWPLFTGGDIFQCWNSLVLPSPIPILVQAIRFPASQPSIGLPLGNYTIPPGAYVYVHHCEWDIGVGDQISFGISMGDVPEEATPGMGLMIIARAS